MQSEASVTEERVRAAEVIAALSLATDLGAGLPLEHGLESTLIAMRLSERLGIDADSASQTYYSCLLFYVGGTAHAQIAAELFPDDAELVTYFTPAMFGSRAEVIAGVMRALAPPGKALTLRALRVVRRLPTALAEHSRHLSALCEVAKMLSERLGLPGSVQALKVHFTERWDGEGQPRGLRREAIPLPVRIAHVAQEAAFQRMVGGEKHATRVIRERAGGALSRNVHQLQGGALARRVRLDATPTPLSNSRVGRLLSPFVPI